MICADVVMVVTVFLLFVVFGINSLPYKFFLRMRATCIIFIVLESKFMKEPLLWDFEERERL